MGSAVTRRAGSGRPKSLLIQLMDILNTVSILSGQLTFVTETFELLTKSSAKFDSLLVNIQLTACSLEKVNFKVSCPLNHVSCFNEISVNAHI